MKKVILTLSLVLAVVGISMGGEKGSKEVTLEELDEITGGGVLDDKIRLWDEAPNRRNDMNIRLKSERTGNSVQYIFEIRNDEVSMK